MNSAEAQLIMFKGVFTTKTWKENVNHNCSPKHDKNTEMAVFQHSLGLYISVLRKLKFNRQNYAQQFCNLIIGIKWTEDGSLQNTITKFI